MKEIILLAGGPSRLECPYDCEVWACATTLLFPETKADKITRVFGIDPIYTGNMQEAIDKAKSCHIPVISVHSYADEHIPIQEIIEMFGSDYLKNTVSYMIAYALFKGYDKLRLYGIDQGPEWTYIATKPYVTHWLGIALGRGIKYELAPSSTLREMFTEVVKANMKDIQRVSQHKLHFEVMPQSKQGMHEGRAFYSKRRDLVCEK